MSVNFSWVIQWMSASTMPINGHPEVVLTAGWQCIGADATNPNVYSASAIGGCTFPQPDEGGSFTPYASLTQDQVLGWCWANGVNKTEIEAYLQANVDSQINPPVTQPPLPWNIPAA
jgi:peptidoglycan hydrolase-like amidase